MQVEKSISQIKSILMVFLGILILYLMSVLANQLVPLFFALFFAILLQPLVHFFKRIVPTSVSILITTLTTLCAFFFIGLILYNAVQSFLSESEGLINDISNNVTPLINSSTSLIGISFERGEIRDSVSNLLQSSSFWSASGSFISSLSSITAEFLMTVLYFIGLVSAITEYEKTINYLLKGKARKDKQAFKSLTRIKDSVSKYIKIKTLVSLITGTFVSIICWLFGLEYVLLWGFIAFVLNYIPYIGSLIAIIPPLLLGIIEFESLSTVFFLFLCLEGVQLIMGNLIEPKWMGDSFSINTVAVLFGFVFWAYLWGAAGMLLAVPLTFMFKVIFENISSAQILVRLMDKKHLSAK